MSLRCLLVDDNDHFLQAARSLLEQEAIAVAGTASSTAEALRRITQLRPDVALIDINLGPEDGFELAKKIAEGPTTVIMISIYAEPDFADLIATSPAIGFVPKSKLSAKAILGVLRASAGEGGGSAGG